MHIEGATRKWRHSVYQRARTCDLARENVQLLNSWLGSTPDQCHIKCVSRQRNVVCSYIILILEIGRAHV